MHMFASFIGSHAAYVTVMDFNFCTKTDSLIFLCVAKV